MPGGLICPASDIFDAAAYDADMARDAPEGSDARTLRGAATSALKSQMARGRDAIAQAFTAAPISAEAAEATAASYAWLTDQVLDRVRDLAVTRLHPLPTPTEGERIAVMAVGGYGRAEMAPFSDVDLLFLTPYKITPWAESIIESMLYILWDLHLKVGHSARTVKDCLRLAREDQTIRTALLENRLLGGDVALAEELNSRLRDLFDGTGPEFIEAKLTERDARHVNRARAMSLSRT